MWNRLAPVRLDAHPPGGQGQPYTDDVVALARELVETTRLRQKEIAARVGVSHMTIGRWARGGGWGHTFSRRPTRLPWQLLDGAERHLAALERMETPDLDAIEAVLNGLLAAREAHLAPRRRRRDASTAPPLPCGRGPG